MKPQVIHALYAKIKKIDGWFSFEAACLFAMVNEMQKEQGLDGHLFEIGVHHGKSAVVLGNMRSARNEELTICDIFDNQELNQSQSGCGSREVFQKNFNKYCENLSGLTIHQCMSSELQANIVKQPVRLFHIDGGHSADETYKDILLASQVIAPHGVIIVDDAFNPSWPGVIEGIIQSVRDRECNIQPFVIGFNKMGLCRPEYQQQYVDGVRDRSRWSKYLPAGAYIAKQMSFTDVDVVSFVVPTWLSENALRTRLSRYASLHPWVKNGVTRPIYKLISAMGAKE